MLTFLRKLDCLLSRINWLFSLSIASASRMGWWDQKTLVAPSSGAPNHTSSQLHRFLCNTPVGASATPLCHFVTHPKWGRRRRHYLRFFIGRCLPKKSFRSAFSYKPATCFCYISFIKNINYQ